MDIDMDPTVLDPNSYLVRNTDVLASEVEDDLMLMHVARDHYVGMNTVGRHIWDLLANPRSVTELCENIATHFETDADACVRDVLDFAATLVDAGLARVIDAPHVPG